MTITQLYLFTVILPNLGRFFDLMLGVFIIGLLVCALVALNTWIDSREEKIPKLYRPVRFLVISSVVVGLIGVSLPSEKQLYMLAGGYVATNAKDVAKLPDNVVKAANAWLEKAAEPKNSK